MSTIVKIMSLISVIAGLSSVAQALPNIDPAFPICTIVYPDGSVTIGNGKNDLCLLLEGEEGVEIIHHKAATLWTAKWNTDVFLCQLESSSEIVVTKEIFRIDNYNVKAFGYEYFGAKGSAPGIVDGLLVKNQTLLNTNEPVSIKFKSSPSGVPESVTIHLQGGTAPLNEDITCEQIY